MKARLKNAFRQAGLKHTVEKRGQRYTLHPSVNVVEKHRDYDFYIFYLPLGMNPGELKKKEYVLTQVFGSNYELKGDGTRYTLKVFTREAEPSYTFDYESLKVLLVGRMPILAGKDNLGKMHAFDMVDHPHLLIAGETGSGKSVTIRMIITSLLLSCRDKVDFYLADMKRSEFHLFRHCESVQAVMTKKSELQKCLTYLQKEMKLRGDLLDGSELDHIDKYNEQFPENKKKYILLCIDEVALLKKENKLMDIVEEISCIGRALGVFLILSMQRPDAKVLEGQLKNNLTVRYAFQHSDKINSDITLGRGSKEDASKLERPGQFYFKSNQTLNVQAPFLSLEAAKGLLEPIKLRPHIIDTEAEIIEETTSDFAPLQLIGEGEYEDPEGPSNP
ncbi:FtsK/SpoIIIE domain-containing protein [Metabacillus sp. 84]|uniref:FtsK/SpoIIIE domain-containing protein n=1 Tax=Metabacillus sp. 84 TaxID=3404705 RepID=UPI003CEB3780